VFAGACCVAAFLFRLLLDPLLQDHSPLLLFALAVAVSASRGLGPGLLATVFGAVASLYFFPPVGTFSVSREYQGTASFQIVIFFGMGAILSYFGSTLRRQRWEAREAAEAAYTALENVRLLSGLLPICAGCKKIRDNRGAWQQMESYISHHSQATFSHSLCPDCARFYYSEVQGSEGIKSQSYLPSWLNEETAFLPEKPDCATRRARGSISSLPPAKST